MPFGINSLAFKVRFKELFFSSWSETNAVCAFTKMYSRPITPKHIDNIVGDGSLFDSLLCVLSQYHFFSSYFTWCHWRRAVLLTSPCMIEPVQRYLLFDDFFRLFWFLFCVGASVAEHFDFSCLTGLEGLPCLLECSLSLWKPQAEQRFNMFFSFPHLGQCSLAMWFISCVVFCFCHVYSVKNRILFSIQNALYLENGWGEAFIPSLETIFWRSWDLADLRH